MRKCLLATSAIAVALTLSGNSFAENNQTLPLTSTLAPNTAARKLPARRLRPRVRCGG